MRNIVVILFAFSNLASCGQNKQDRITLGRKYAEQELKLALTDTTKHNVISSDNIILKDSLTATAVAEAVLFSIYGKTNITKQKPYEINHLNNFWVLNGTLPKGTLGGTFLIIIDERNSRIIKITHGK